jgi:hypothetical protein
MLIRFIGLDLSFTAAFQNKTVERTRRSRRSR